MSILICTLNCVRFPSVGHAVGENQRGLPIQEIVHLAFDSVLKELGLCDLGSKDLKKKKVKEQNAQGLCWNT